MERERAKECFDQANACYRQGDPARALALLEPLHAHFPDNANLLYAMALCLERLNRREEALALVNESIAAGIQDKGFILKARLITTPSDPPYSTDQEEADLGAPFISVPMEAPSPLTSAPHVRLSGGTASAHRWIIGTLVGIIALFVLLPVLTVFFAQADTTVPGALPTLFPLRLAAVYGGIMALMGMEILLLFLQCIPERAAVGFRQFYGAAIGGCISLIPVVGWIAVPWVFLHRAKASAGIIGIAVAIIICAHFMAAILIGTVLGLASPREIFLELKAGF